MIIDGGNTYYADTERRTKYVEDKGLLYIGTGVSGGEEGALKGPSMMPGGSADAWPLVKPIFQAIAAKVGPKNDIPCCEWVGPRGAGHYVKMVHNGIEYGDMQLICEAYFMLKEALGLTNDELYDVFDDWNRGELESYLIEITRDIFSVKDKGRRLPGRQDPGQGRREGHRQMDEPAGARPRRAQHAGDRSRLRPLPLGNERRPRAGEQSPQRPLGQVQRAIARSSSMQIRHALYASKICSYAQGFVQLQAAAEEYNWPLNYGDCRHALARRLHHPGRVPRSHQRSVRRRCQTRKPAARALLHQSGRRSPGRLAARRSTAAELGIPCPRSRPPWPTTTATAATACPPTCCKPSAITSAPTPTNEPISPAHSTPIGFANAATVR